MQGLYSRIAASDLDESTEKLLGLSEPTGYASNNMLPRRPLLRHWPWIANGAMLFLNATIFFVLVTTSPPNIAKCVGMLSTYSPAHVAVEYQTVRYNGSLDHRSPWKGTPNAELDAAWDMISMNNTLRPIRISDDVLDKVHKSGRLSNVRFAPEDGGGNMGSIEVFHQLHCLNMLRKYTYPDYYPELQDLWRTRPGFIRDHLDHCVEMIRQNLMCASDTGVITYDWIQGHKIPFPDFNTYHQCRNFDKILEWTKANNIHLPRENIRRLGGEVDVLGPLQ